jgi:CheY-like chemotaxis protein
MVTHENMKLLIVDDEEELREILVEQLRGLTVQAEGLTYNLDIQTATDGAQALEQFRSIGFDALLTDINMPEMNGLELLGALRGQGSDIPSIVLTGFGDKDKAAEALRLGCFAFLDKPWKAQILRKTVTAALESGFKLRPLNRKVEDRVEHFSSQTDTRQRQLRTVFRSMLVGDDGSHRNDVCQVPNAGRNPRKKPA